MTIAFDRENATVFRFDEVAFDELTGTARLSYSFIGGPKFTETISFPPPFVALDDVRRAALLAALRELWWFAGVSYYKAAAPPRLELPFADLSDQLAADLRSLYQNGLAEFAFENELDLSDRCTFEAAGTEPFPAPAPVEKGELKLARRTAVPIGGGKDSCVTIEALRAKGEEMLLISVGAPPAIVAVAEAAKLPHLVIRRQLDAELFACNVAGAYNGHVPVTAVVSAIIAVAAVLYDFDTIAMSNERSANVGSFKRDGHDVNHQYSKGLECERLLARRFAGAVPGLRYFSLLRPLSELQIAQLFARADRYFDVFTSCNAAFRIDVSRRVGRWCGDCPKCRFVFLALATQLPRTELLKQFGSNLLDDSAQADGFAALAELDGRTKPFECVGQKEESRLALLQLLARDEWRENAVLVELKPLLCETTDERSELETEVFRFSDEHLLPDRYEANLRAYLA